MLTCVVLHNMLRSHRGGGGGGGGGGGQADHSLQPMTYNHQRMTRGSRDRMKTSEIPEGGQPSTRPTERLLQQHRDTGWAGEQNLRRLRGEQAVINESFKDYPNDPRTIIAKVSHTKKT